MGVFAELKTQVSSVNARVRKDGVAVTSLTVQIRDLDHLHKLLTKLETLKEVRRVYRVTKRERAALVAASSDRRPASSRRRWRRLLQAR